MRRGKTLYVILGCDCDPDRSRYGGTLLETRPADYRWLGITKGIPRLKHMCAELRDRLGQEPKFTWCVRCDEQMRMAYGDSAWPLAKFKQLWNKLEAEGDEISWHLHLWRWSEASNCWYQETEDRAWIDKVVRESHADFVRQWPGGCTSLRMGWVYHSNLTMRLISDLGIQVDFSAVPGQYGIPGRTIKRRRDFADWQIATSDPYFPSVADYRRPAWEGENSHSVLEVPCSVLHSRLWSIANQAARMVKYRTPQPLSLSRPYFGATVSMWPKVFSAMVPQILANSRKAQRSTALLISYFHADELLRESSSRIQTFVYSAENICQNIAYILSKAQDELWEVQFTTATAFRGQVGAWDIE